MANKTPKTKKTVETLTHEESSRRNIPTAEYQSVMRTDELSPVQVAYPRGASALEEEKRGRNRDLDPQLVWRGKDEQDWSDLVVPAPPLYIQEKVHPKVLVDDLLRQSEAGPKEDEQFNLFADFNGLPSEEARTEFYQHEGNWTNRMILGDSLQVMASLAEREGLRGQVQCIYIDPPYGIKFNSNFQWSTTSRDVRDGNVDHITREPEQVKAFRDTWRDGIHSYLTYLRDRFTAARDLLADSGAIFVQIGDENVHRVRAVMDEVFGAENSVALITVSKTAGQTAEALAGVADFILFYAKKREFLKFRKPLRRKTLSDDESGVYRCVFDSALNVRRLTTKDLSTYVADRGDGDVFRLDNITSQRPPGSFPVAFKGRTYGSGRGYWKTGELGMERLIKANRVNSAANSITYIRFLGDFRAAEVGNVWSDTATGSFTEDKLYVVQSAQKLVERCVMMATDPGDLVLDPTCGSGTTAYVAEQWGRRWITIDTSRVALALARARIMGARYSYYLLTDSEDGQRKEGEISGTVPSLKPTHGNVRQGFVYERVPHITLKSIANNAEIDVIWEKSQKTLEPLRAQLNQALGKAWEEWEIPRESETNWSEAAKKAHAEWWKQRIARQKEIDASIGAKAEFEYLYDKPYEDKKKVRVAGPFTVESLSPHRVLTVDEDDRLVDPQKDPRNEAQSFVEMILDNLKLAGVQQAHKDDKIVFSSLTPWPGNLVCAEGRYSEGDTDKRAAIFIGPEFGTVSRPDLVAAAREAGDAGFDVLVACAFNYDAHSSEFNKLGRIPVLKARMNADLHMAGDLKNTGKGNLFVIFGEPDIDILTTADGRYQVKVNGVDVFHPNTGEVRSDGPEGIACWFVDTDYNEESFFVRHAYFLGANDPYKALKTTLKAEINEEAWETLHSDISRPFDKPQSGRIAVKVINHLGDEVMKVFRIE
jgi:adenine-specific DNA-methyltransferase